MNWAWAATILFNVIISVANAESFIVGDFSKNGLNGWEEKKFNGKTDYVLKQDGEHTVLEAHSKAGASGYYKKVQIDLDKTPYLNWSWKVKNVLDGVNEKTKEGDDYPARVYVVFSSGILFWKTRALNYVWSSNQQSGVSWPNAFASSARMIAVEGSGERLGQWVTYKRNIRADFKEFFGEDVSHADAIAVMTDTDNSRQSAIAWYGDIFFTSE